MNDILKGEAFMAHTTDTERKTQLPPPTSEEQKRRLIAYIEANKNNPEYVAMNERIRLASEEYRRQVNEEARRQLDEEEGK
jgi:hypothetical protein